MWFSASSECESISASTISGDITSPSGTISAGNYVGVEWNIPDASSAISVSLYHENNKVYIYTGETEDDGYYQVNIYSGMSNFPNSSCWHFKIASSSNNYIMGQYFTIE